MTEPEVIKPQCESVEATSHDTDEAGSSETHGEKEPAHEQPHHGVLDMGFDDDAPQEVAAMEVDVITADKTDFKDLMKTLTRDNRDEMATVTERS